MAKPILLKTASIDLEDTTLLCVSLLTLCRRFTTSSARKPKVLNANGIKVC